MSTLKERLEEVREERKLSKSDIWKGAGKSSGAYSHWMNGGGMDGETLVKVAKILRVTPYWLATGTGEKYITVSEAPDIKGAVPLISWVQAGLWMEAIDNLQPGDGERIDTTYKARTHTYALRVHGDSMEPRFPEGAILIVEPEESPSAGKFVIVRQANSQEATFKQLVQDGNQLFLKPLNPRYPIMVLGEGDVFCGVVKRVEYDV
jgi:SOS-response transcriptional repressor LexA